MAQICAYRAPADPPCARRLAAYYRRRNSIAKTSPNVIKELNMVAAVRVHKPGGPEALTYEDAEIPAPGQGQIKIKKHASGVNFIDAYFRRALSPPPVGLPFIAGNESAGEVMAVGPGVTDIKVGDRVAYVGPLGGYAAERVVPGDRAVKLPDNISYEQAAGMMLKGMTVQYLLNRTYKVEKGTVCLIHAAT